MSGYLDQLYKSNLSLLTDLYQLTMANGYWKSDRHDTESVFTLFYRKNPYDCNYVVAAGLEQAIHQIQNFEFNVDDIRYLANIKNNKGTALFDESFLNMLQRLDFKCNIDAVPEGTIVFPNEPILSVKGPLIQAQLIETLLLNSINYQSLIATKSAAIVTAAQGDPVLEFGLRRAPGIDGSLSATRAAFIGGCSATSNVLGGKIFNIPVKGTQAHSWIMSFDSELKAFRAYALANPHNVVLLVDTYNTIQGVKNAVKIGLELRAENITLNGIRLDSGDLTQLSIQCRKILDEAGFQKTKILASNDLDEQKINQYKKDGAKIDIWGVGTQLVTGGNSVSLGGVYKLSAIKDKLNQWDYKIKLSENPIKISNPGILNTKRFYKNGIAIRDEIYDQSEPERIHLKNITQSLKSQDLLIPIFESGKLVYTQPSLNEIQAFVKHQLSNINITDFKVTISPTLQERKEKMIKLKQAKSALLLVDIQNDFLPLGNLEVKDGHEVIDIANQIMDDFDIIIATKDWHPGDHQSFAANHLWRRPGQIIDLHGIEQILWPMHCVQDSMGADFPNELNSDKIQHIIKKGQNPEIDSYSGFFDNDHKSSTGLHELLSELGVQNLTIMGLATDYCVKYTALDAIDLGYNVSILKKGCRAINTIPEDGQNAIDLLVKKGAIIV